jgi:hypothetical protein
MVVTFSEYASLYDPIDGKVFNRLAFEADRYMNKLTTGIDGVKKLKVAFPVDEDSVMAVKHCAAKVVNILYQIQSLEATSMLERGLEKTENGYKGKVVSSISAGNESVYFSSGGSQKTLIDTAMESPAALDNLIHKTIRDYLSGVCDANGVNLLYMGVYPCV